MAKFPVGRERSSRLTGCVKMADCIRVPLLLPLLCLLPLLSPIRGDNGVVANPGANADNLQNPPGAAGPAAGNAGAAERNLAAGASPLRRRTAGWKLSDEAVCRDDLTRLCPKHSWNNNLAVLECLQDKKEVSLRRCMRGEPAGCGHSG